MGEITGLRWCDIDLEEGIIDVNHTLVYYAHRDEVHKHGCYYNVNTPKTKASTRQVPMLDFVKEAFIMEREYQEAMGIKCEVTIDGYTDFILSIGLEKHKIWRTSTKRSAVSSGIATMKSF